MSFARNKLITEIEPHKESIVRVHTDGFISTKTLPFELSDDLGGWKIETDKCGDCEINGLNNIKWLKD